MHDEFNNWMLGYRPSEWLRSEETLELVPAEGYPRDCCCSGRTRTFRKGDGGEKDSSGSSEF